MTLATLLIALLPFALGQEPQPAAGPAGATDQTPSVAMYRLNPGDTIELRHFFNPELNEQMQIRPDGRVWLQLIGEVDLAGLTVQEAATMLEDLYRKEVRTPKISIQIRGFALQKVYVTGEVLRPGVLGLPGPMTVLDAINEAGGIKHSGNQKMIVLIHKGPDGKPVGKKLQLYQKKRLAADASIQLNPFDVVVVPETKVAHLDRWVDEHIRQVIPFNTAAGFTYLITRQNSSSTIPIF